MGTSLCSSSVQSAFNLIMLIFRVTLVLSSLVLVKFAPYSSSWESNCLRVLYFSHLMYSLTHLVIHSFCFTSYEFVFLLTSMCSSFLMGMSMFPYISYAHVRLLIWDIFHLHVVIAWASHIMEDIKPIDLGLRDRHRKIEIETHFT